MKKTVLGAILLLTVSPPAMAERQIYSAYPQPAFADVQGLQQNGREQSYNYHSNTYMVYPGREEYGQNFGPIPRHPGDYKDAVDRGAWTGGGNAGSSSPRIR